MTGGGTGGHVIPAVAVASELRGLGHEAVFIGTRRGLEATIVPRAGFDIEWIEIGGLKRVGLLQTLKTIALLPGSVWKSWRVLRARRAAAVFSMGGYVAAPAMLAATLSSVPIVVMEPNAMPGLVSRKLAGTVSRALIGFEESRKYFPEGRTEVTGLPVRQEFFDIQPRRPDGVFHVLITGGSRGAHALNKAASESWPLFRNSGKRVRIVLQCGADEHHALAREFNEYGLEGEVAAFIHDMPAAYAAADLVVSRSGAGAVSELTAAGRAAILVPFPAAADDHQRHNAEALQRAGAARVVLQSEWSGQKLFAVVSELMDKPAELAELSRSARALSKPGAARRAAEVLVELGRKRQRDGENH
ncbi:undecaprenyldiphospho-muramoylpentapeptide beta-N-acetylglucosaminyltransferase [uncultured Paludibaculum sp.]|uniref:undecaprenyldiphospho-muramoylpentapeptide beta-N-acetylglucosaminyltransferase n=1 Tax=uncultured Paludibaculum sp. TaxID=1765020 RepID=UPI002AAC14EC|nr:undecaprenyldiphospho-muramoylpentapeptide beta-N-acetylglucosaminyltransferase [uncultured Paludibaculum sp.]